MLIKSNSLPNLNELTTLYKDKTINKVEETKSSPTLLDEQQIMNKSARIIQDGFKNFMYFKSYMRLFNNLHNKNLLERYKYKVNDFTSFKLPLNFLSSIYLKEIKKQIGVLSELESSFIERIINEKFIFKHQSTDSLIKKINKDEQLLISSHYFLKNSAINVLKCKTLDYDERVLCNDAFCFFSTEINNEDSPQYHLYRNEFYGDNCYIINEKNHYSSLGYLTLTDHAYTTISENECLKEDIEFFQNLVPDFLTFLRRRIYGPFGLDDRIIFSFSDMKKGLAYYLVDFIRDVNSTALSNYCYNPSITSKQLNTIVNTFLTPEFHIPYKIKTKDYTYINLQQKHDEYKLKINNEKELAFQELCKDDNHQYEVWNQELTINMHSFTEKDIAKFLLNLISDFENLHKEIGFKWTTSTKFKSNNNDLVKIITVLELTLKNSISKTYDPFFIDEIHSLLNKECGFDSSTKNSILLKNWKDSDLRNEKFNPKNQLSVDILKNGKEILENLQDMEDSLLDFIQ